MWGNIQSKLLIHVLSLLFVYILTQYSNRPAIMFIWFVIFSSYNFFIPIHAYSFCPLVPCVYLCVDMCVSWKLSMSYVFDMNVESASLIVYLYAWCCMPWDILSILQCHWAILEWYSICSRKQIILGTLRNIKK